MAGGVAPSARPASLRPAPTLTAARVEVAPYVLVRVAAVDQPPTGDAARRLRLTQAELVDLLRDCRSLAPGLTDDLYRLGGQVPDAYRHSVLLPLRRAVHNGRSPAGVPTAALADLVTRLPALRRWLAARDRIDQLTDDLTAGAGPVLADERAALAGLCGSEPVGRAVASTSPELLAAVLRTADRAGTPDARGRGSEPTVLRYALRATTRISPLSWFTTVGWSTWPDPPTPENPEPGVGVDLVPAGAPVAVTRPPASLVASLFLAAAAQPDRMLRTPHRLAPGLHDDGRHIVFHREHPGRDAAGDPVVREERVLLPARPALTTVVGLLRDEPAGRPPEELVATLAGPGADEAAGRLVRRFLAQLCAQRLLVPVPPATEHDPAALAAVAGWLADTGSPDLADRVRGLDRDIRALADTEARERGPLVRRIAEGWRRALADLDATAPRHTPATEDVVLPRPARLTRPPVEPGDLAALTGLALLFDQDQLTRRVLRHRFVERYGPGGRCPDSGQFFADLGGGPGGTAPELADLARLRRQVVDAARDGGTVLPTALAAGVVDVLPAWLRARPASYAFFGQPDSDGTFVLNHVYGGWGRFTSRFLDLFADGRMRALVGDRVRRTLPGRVAQFRPVHGFNANLHPLLADEEISDDPRVGGIDPAAVELVHDPATDQVRLRHRDTGDLLDVLYLGFLSPPAMPARLAALLGDLGGGEVDLGQLAATHTVTGPGGDAVVRDRLRCGRVVLARRSWRFDAGAGDHLRATVGSLSAAASLRAAWDLPDQVFLREGSAGTPAGAAVTLRRAVTRPKPQFVDLASPLHLRCLPRWLDRITGALVVEEALPAPAGHDRPHRPVELVLETYLPEAGRA